MSELSARLATAGNMQTVAWGLLVFAALSLIVACSNVGGLLLLEREARGTEIALKAALGASPLRLFRETASGALAITCAGTAAAIPLTWVALRVASRLWVLPMDMPMALDARVDLRMAAVAVGVLLIATLLCSVAPGSATLQKRTPHIASSRITGANHHGLNALVIVELTLATALAGSGASLLAGMRSVEHADLGYRTDHILLLTFDPAQTRASENRTRAFYHDLLERTAQVPGVRAAVLAQSVPLGFTAAQKQVKIPATGSDPLALWMNTVTPGYFELMRIGLVNGRDFSATDTDSSPAVAIVNEAVAKLWPDQRALGRKLEIDGRGVEIVGVVKTVKYHQAGESAKPFLYLPYAQNFVARMTLHVLTQGSPAAAAPLVVTAARGVDPAQAAAGIRPFAEFLMQGALFGARICVSVTASPALAPGSCPSRACMSAPPMR